MQWSTLCLVFITISVLTNTDGSEIPNQGINYEQLKNHLQKNSSIIGNEDNAEQLAIINGLNNSSREDSVYPSVDTVASPQVNSSQTDDSQEPPSDHGHHPVNLQNTTITDAERSIEPKSNVHVQSHYSMLESVSAKMLIGESNNMSIQSLSSSKRTNPLFEKENLNAFSVDYDYKKGLIFYMTDNKIIRANLTGRTVTSVEPIVPWVDQPARLAVDWEHDRVYWMSDKYQTVEVAGLDGSNRTLLVDNIKPFAYPNNIAVDPYEKVVFFVSDFAVFKSDLHFNRIENIRLEGISRGGEERTVRSLALDRHNRKLYYSGRGFNRSVYIEHVNYDGSDPVTLLTLPEIDIYGLEVFNNTLYFAQYATNFSDSLWRVDVLQEKPKPEIFFAPRKSAEDIWSMRVVHPCVQRRVDPVNCPITKAARVPFS